MTTPKASKKAPGPEVHDQGVDGDGLPVWYIHNSRIGRLRTRPYCDVSAYGAGAPPRRVGNFREILNLMPFPWSCDKGA